MSMTMQNVYFRVCAWNHERYVRIQSKDLLIRLLKEELDEYFDSSTEVDKLDALCDTTYVALGGIWKANAETAEINAMMDSAQQFASQVLTEASQMPAAVAIGLLHDFMYEHNGNNFSLYFCSYIVNLCIAEALKNLNLTFEQFIDAMLVVCDSNDSKVVEKVASDVKANDGNKGADFVAPEPRLQEILDKRTSH